MDGNGLHKSINEEYKLWKKNAVFLYDTLITHALEWPTLTTQWLPDTEKIENGTVHRLLLGTHTSDSEPNYLVFANVTLPDLGEPNLDELDEAKNEIGSYSDRGQRTKIVQKIAHQGEPNRARYAPFNPNLIATKAVSGEVFIFDRTKHVNFEENVKPKPDLILKGHTKEGYGLAWNPAKSQEGHLLSASDDTTICHWDVRSYSRGSNTINPLNIYQGHDDIVEDVAFHWTDPTVFGSVGDDKKLLIWDTKAPKTPVSSTIAHSSEVNSLSFSPINPNILLTGGADSTVKLWDLRNLSTSIHSFEHHEDEVLNLQWSDTDPTMFASSSADRRLIIWDASLIGQEQTPDEAEDGPPELVFMHGGHTSKITDFDYKEGNIVSAAEDNIIQMWRPSDDVFLQHRDVSDKEIE